MANPNQPRDSRGRFTSGGGLGSATLTLNADDSQFRGAMRRASREIDALGKAHVEAGIKAKAQADYERRLAADIQKFGRANVMSAQQYRQEVEKTIALEEKRAAGQVVNMRQVSAFGLLNFSPLWAAGMMFPEKSFDFAGLAKGMQVATVAAVSLWAARSVLTWFSGHSAEVAESTSEMGVAWKEFSDTVAQSVEGPVSSIVDEFTSLIRVSTDVVAGIVRISQAILSMPEEIPFIGGNLVDFLTGIGKGGVMGMLVPPAAPLIAAAYGAKGLIFGGGGSEDEDQQERMNKVMREGSQRVADYLRQLNKLEEATRGRGGEEIFTAALEVKEPAGLQTVIGTFEAKWGAGVDYVQQRLNSLQMTPQRTAIESAVERAKQQLTRLEVQEREQPGGLKQWQLDLRQAQFDELAKLAGAGYAKAFLEGLDQDEGLEGGLLSKFSFANDRLLADAKSAAETYAQYLRSIFEDQSKYGVDGEQIKQGLEEVSTGRGIVIPGLAEGLDQIKNLHLDIMNLPTSKTVTITVDVQYPNGYPPSGGGGGGGDRGERGGAGYSDRSGRGINESLSRYNRRLGRNYSVR